MSSAPSFSNPGGLPLGLGLAAAVLGTVGLMLFLFPVLSIPLGIIGTLLGLVGILTSWSQGGVRLRWALLGTAMSLLALGVGFGLNQAKTRIAPTPDVPSGSGQSPGRPYVSPPER